MNDMIKISALTELHQTHKAILCDVWGVIHNGIVADQQSCAALAKAREAGLPVVLITNSPRPNKGVIEQLDGLGVSRDTYDGIVTSGDVTQKLIAENAPKVFHLGPERDKPLFDGLGVQLVKASEAATIVCTGLFDDETETPEDYAEMLGNFQTRDIPFICANPDLVVHRGNRLIPCAGALARDYALLGGRTLIAGKPHRPIYLAAIERLKVLTGNDYTAQECLAIGDGMPTDIKGADGFGCPVLYISGGIHAAEYGPVDTPDWEALSKFVEAQGYNPVATMPRLR